MPDVKIEMTVEIQVWCGTCGAGLCSSSTGGDETMHVEACKDCIVKSREEGYDDGHTVGYDEGYEKGQEDGN